MKIPIDTRERGVCPDTATATSNTRTRIQNVWLASMTACAMRVRAVVSTGSGELVTRGDSRTSEALQILAQMTLAPHSDIEENGEDAEGAEASKHV